MGAAAARREPVPRPKPRPRITAPPAARGQGDQGEERQLKSSDRPGLVARSGPAPKEAATEREALGAGWASRPSAARSGAVSDSTGPIAGRSGTRAIKGTASAAGGFPAI